MTGAGGFSPLHQPPPKLRASLKQHTGRLTMQNMALFPIIDAAANPSMKQVKPLPLQGTHFKKRADTYDIPQDDTEYEPPVYRKIEKKSAWQLDPDDSPLSEDELETAYDLHASPIHSQHSSAVVPVLKSKRLSNPAVTKETNRTKNKANTKTHILSKTYVIPANVQKKKQVVLALAPSKRRLPVNELTMIAPSPDDDYRERCASSLGSQMGGLLPVDSSPLITRLSSPIEDEDSPKVPLTTIRKRLKTPKFAHKSVGAVRKKQGTRTPLSDLNSNISALGDGFEVSELKIKPRPPIKKQPQASIKKQRKTPIPLALELNALILQSGPLPEVIFEPSATELKMESNTKTHTDLVDVRDCDPFANDACTTPKDPERDNCKVNFTDRVLDDDVRAQLSSITAPKRAYSYSSDESGENFVNTDDESEPTEANENESEEGEEEEEQEFSVPEDESDNGIDEEEPPSYQSSQRPPSNQQAMQKRSLWRTPPNLPSTHHLTSHSVPPNLHHPVPSPGRTPFRNRTPAHLHEPNPSPSDDEDTELLDDEAPEPRSILRTVIPSLQTTDTHRRHTAANTRRNSVLNSRYFTTATTSLNTHDYKPPRIPRHKSNQLRAEYLARQDIHVPDSESFVPETSSPLEFNASSGTGWPSGESLPAVEAGGDLKSLTRRVSMVNGTLSQSVRRRRASLAFRSPVKGRGV